MRIPLALLPLGLLLATVLPANADPMTAGDRQRLIAHLEMTESWLVSELEGLSEAQLNFRTAPDTATTRCAARRCRSNRQAPRGAPSDARAAGSGIACSIRSIAIRSRRTRRSSRGQISR